MLLQDKASAERSRSRRPLVSLTPLIDVVFILLVFFMLVSSFSSERVIELLTPAETSSGTADNGGAVLVRLRPGGAIDLNGVSVSRAQLAQQIGVWSVAGQPRRYLVQPAPGVTTQQAVTVLDLLQAAGAANVSLIRR